MPLLRTFLAAALTAATAFAQQPNSPAASLTIADMCDEPLSQPEEELTHACAPAGLVTLPQSYGDQRKVL